MNMLTEAAVEKALDQKMSNVPYKMIGKDVSVYYGEKRALFDVNLNIRENTVTALIGPSGCGKSTFLRSLNRMNDTIDGCRVTGKITLDTDDIYDPDIDVVELRARVGMVFQKPNPFPKTIYENVSYGPRIHGLAKSKADLDQIVEAVGKYWEAGFTDIALVQVGGETQDFFLKEAAGSLLDKLRTASPGKG